MTVNKEHMELWVQALESDQHQQCIGALRKGARRGGTFAFPNGTTSWWPAKPEMHCALGIGVLVALQHGVSEYDEYGQSVWDAYTVLPGHIMSFYGLDHADPRVTINGEEDSIISHNDLGGHSFWTIAQAMRAEFLKEES